MHNDSSDWLVSIDQGLSKRLDFVFDVRASMVTVVRLIIASIWLVGASYIYLTVWLVNRFSPKLLVDMSPQQIKKSAVWIEIYKMLAPVWEFDKFIIPAWLLVAVTVTLIGNQLINRDKRQ